MSVVLTDMENSFLEIIFEDEILEWRSVVLELIKVNFNFSFLLSHLCSVAQAFFLFLF